MPDINALLAQQSAYPEVDRAYRVALRIAQKPTSIVVQRDGTADLSAQTVRLEPVAMPGEQGGEMINQSQAQAVILGYKGHPTIADTNLRRGDFFVANDVRYEVIQVIHEYSDRLMATARVTE